MQYTTIPYRTWRNPYNYYESYSNYVQRPVSYIHQPQSYETVRLNSQKSAQENPKSQVVFLF